ncbi:MAG: SPOR domain-containing protein, partial [Proteobacteria bacterium]|nr:SPOR domain-containing protein [Pseudomonadota bacterium]
TVSPVQSGEKILYRVRVGPVASGEELLEVQQILQDNGYPAAQALP